MESGIPSNLFWQWMTNRINSDELVIDGKQMSFLDKLLLEIWRDKEFVSAVEQQEAIDQQFRTMSRAELYGMFTGAGFEDLGEKIVNAATVTDPETRQGIILDITADMSELSEAELAELDVVIDELRATAAEAETVEVIPEAAAEVVPEVVAEAQPEAQAEIIAEEGGVEPAIATEAQVTTVEEVKTTAVDESAPEEENIDAVAAEPDLAEEIAVQDVVEIYESAQVALIFEQYGLIELAANWEMMSPEEQQTALANLPDPQVFLDELRAVADSGNTLAADIYGMITDEFGSLNVSLEEAVTLFNSVPWDAPDQIGQVLQQQISSGFVKG